MSRWLDEAVMENVRDVGVDETQDCQIIPGHGWCHSKGWVKK